MLIWHKLYPEYEERMQQMQKYVNMWSLDELCSGLELV